MICSLSPNVRGDGGKDRGGTLVDLVRQCPESSRSGGRVACVILNPALPAHAREFLSHGAEHQSLRVSDPALTACPPIESASLGQGTDARLKELVGRDTEEIGNPVQVFKLDLAIAC